MEIASQDGHKLLEVMSAATFGEGEGHPRVRREVANAPTRKEVNVELTNELVYIADDCRATILFTCHSSMLIEPAISRCCCPSKFLRA
jgi:hypothetical protein